MSVVKTNHKKIKRKYSILKKATTGVESSLRAISLSLEDLADIQFDSLVGDREEQLGILCYKSKSGKYSIKKVDSINDAFISSPDVGVFELKSFCEKGEKMTLWHTHGTNLRSFSDFDRYTASDLSAVIGNVGLCSLGIDALQCHYAFFSPPVVVNIGWEGKLLDRIKNVSEKKFNGNTLSCSSSLECRIRDWSKGVKEQEVGEYDQVNLLDGLTASVNKDGSFISSASKNIATCYKIVSKDGYTTLNCTQEEIDK